MQLLLLVLLSLYVLFRCAVSESIAKLKEELNQLRDQEEKKLEEEKEKVSARIKHEVTHPYHSYIHFFRKCVIWVVWMLIHVYSKN